MLESRKAKAIVLGILLVAFCPIYFLSDYGLNKRVEGLWANETDPRTPEKLLQVAWIFDCTWRPEQADEIAKAWLKRFGGDETEFLADMQPEGITRYLQFEGAWWTEENPRPEAWPKIPHPMTPEALVMLGEHLERNRRYQECKHLFKIVKKKFPEDKLNQEKADQALLRDRTRSF